MKNKITLLLLSVVLLNAACQQENSQDEQYVHERIADVKAAFAPDKRVAIFAVEPVQSNKTMVLKGETNLAAAKNALLDSLKNRDVAIVDSIRILPASALGGKTYALVNNSVANIRSEAGHSAELATQALLGTPLNVLKREGEWYLVQTPDQYISWVDHGGIIVLDEAEIAAWKTLPKVIYRKVAGFSYSGESVQSTPVSDLVMGNVLVKTGETEQFCQVQYPDGRTGYVLKSEVSDLDEWISQAEPTGENLSSVAFQLMGAPYLWGGTSTKGMDCSGFTKTIYFMNGLVIPRDASQQVHAGEPVETGAGWEELQTGDLLFFGTPATAERKERVVHVGMWIGDQKFIHASGMVRISSVDPTSELYDEFNTKRFLRARKYAPNYEGNIRELKTDLIY